MEPFLPKELLIFFTILGIFPVKRLNTLHMDKIQFSPAVFIYSLALVAFQAGACFYTSQYEVNMTKVKIQNNTTFVVMVCDIFSLGLSAVVAVVSSGWNCGPLARLYGEMQRFDDVLKTKPSQSRYRRWLLIGLASLTGIFAANYYVRHTLDSRMPFHLPVIPLHLMALAIQLQYMTVVDSIRARFLLVNERIVYELQCHRFAGLLKLTSTLPAVELATDIREGSHRQHIGIPGLSDLHWTLCSIIHKTNGIFSWALLAHMFSLFLHIIIAPYFLFFYVNLYSQDLLSHNNLSFLFLQCSWAVAHSLNLILLVVPCTATSQEAERTAPIICKHLNREMRPETRKQLETFVLQLLHHKTEFSVFDLFPLHCPILTSIAGAVTTYLVILIQFQNADDMNTSTAKTSS